ncbi:MAG: sensor domain-containing phosphodiesterase [Salinibacterium sp.]|nr:sensor domain-containing phosphodiesterase [Salinibacterium sp.]MBF0671333.1 sensor domain-containing phosphodiesterase [Salinibacterium sp.]
MTTDATAASTVALDFEMLFRAAPAGAVITGADHTVLDVNEAFTTWTGLDRVELLGSSFLRLLSVGDRILFTTRTQPLLELNGRVPESAVTILGKNRVALPATLVASFAGSDAGVTVFITVPRRERSFEEAQLISAVHRAEESDARRRQAEDDLKRQANLDSLTGLMNGAGLTAALTRAVTDSSSGSEVAAYWIALDQFRIINESLGRAAGDDILRTIAERLRQQHDGDALVARVGGDEFVVTTPGGDLEKFAQDLLSLIAKPLTVEGLDIVISASIGVATQNLGAAPSAAADIRPVAESLLRNAGAGALEAKAAGRNRWKRSTATPDDSAINEIQLLGDLRVALADEQLRLEYQPQLDLHTGRVHGVEALVRWEHPGRGLIGPAGFIDVAEKTGLISQLGTWVCRTAIAKAIELNSVPGAEPIQMSVNISARQLSDADFANTIEELLQSTGFDPARLTVEITETGVITDAPHAHENLERLHQLGIRLSVDDFGTGHAGFSYLSDFPIDEIKIDRSFVSKLGVSPEATAIITSCIELAHALDVTVVAEGVETREQLAGLTELGCDIAQGFHYSRPLKAEALGGFLSV